MAEKPIKEANNITLEGYEVLGKLVKSGGGKRQSATVSEKKVEVLEKKKAFGTASLIFLKNNITFYMLPVTAVSL